MISFHFFVDLCTDTSIRFEGEPTKLTSYEQATTAFIFINFLLSISATVRARAVHPLLVLFALRNKVMSGAYLLCLFLIK